MKRKIKNNFVVKGKVRAILKDAKTGKIKKITFWNDNLIPNVGLQAFARVFIGEGLKANEGQATYGAVGSGTVSPLAGDTVMEAEEARKLITVTSRNGAIASIEAFFNESEANTTLYHAALFGEDATATPDSGTLMEYAAFAEAITKTDQETLVVEWQITFASA